MFPLLTLLSLLPCLVLGRVGIYVRLSVSHPTFPYADHPARDVKITPRQP